MHKSLAAIGSLLSVLLAFPAVAAAGQSFIYTVTTCNLPGTCTPQVVVYDAATRQLVGRIPLQAQSTPFGLASSRDGTRVYVSFRYYDNLMGRNIMAIATIDSARLQVTNTSTIYEARFVSGGQLALNRDGSRLFATLDFFADVYDTQSNAVVSGLLPSKEGLFRGIVSSPTVDRVYAASLDLADLTPVSTDVIDEYDTRTGSQLRGKLMDPAGTISDLFVSRDGARLYATVNTFAGANPVSVRAYDPSTLTLLGSVSLPESDQTVDARSHHRIYTLARGMTGTLSFIDFDSFAVLRTMPVANADWMTVTADESSVWIGTTDGNIHVIDLTLETEIAIIPAGSQTIRAQVLVTPQFGPAPDAPFGSVDAPADNVTGVTGAMALTGWALDDVAVARVRVYRDAVAGEGGPVYVGDANFVDGARPDVAAAYPGLPNATRAGWGLMILTNMLPAGGNGKFHITVYADDVDGHTVALGSRTITCSNALASLPFGTIDTPGQGDTASGTVVNFGWALSPTSTIAFDGSTIDVLIDGGVVGHPTYGFARADIDSVFPGYANTGHAVGYFIIDTTKLSNGVHTIAWIVRDDAGAMQGVGSRFFTVANQ